MPEDIQQSKSNSLQTVLAVINIMIGPVMLMLPTDAIESGLILSLIVNLVIGLIEYVTCSYIISYQKPEERDIKDIIKRILGEKSSKIFGFLSSLQIFVMVITTFQFLNTCLYHITIYIMHQAGSTFYQENIQIISFDMYSIQYQCILVCLLVFFIFCLKDISFMIRLSKYGVIAIVIFICFLIYLMFDNIFDGNLGDNKYQVHMFSNKIAAISGPMAQAYCLHNYISPVAANNKNQQNNIRDVFYGFFLSFLIYDVVICCGFLGLIGRNNGVADKQTFADYFTQNNYLPVIVQALLFIQLFSAIPIVFSISRKQFLSFFYQDRQPPKWAFFCYNTAECVCCLTLQILSVNPSTVISINSTILSSIFIYVMPFLFWYKVNFKQDNIINAKDEQQLCKQLLNKQNIKGDQSLNQNNESLLIFDQDISNLTQTLNKVNHQQQIVRKNLQLCSWVIILLIGAALFVIQIMNIFGF